MWQIFRCPAILLQLTRVIILINIPYKNLDIFFSQLLFNNDSIGSRDQLRFRPCNGLVTESN